MFSEMRSNQYETTAQDVKVVMAKSADDLAESLEIMVVETRPIGDMRTKLRGAISLLRKEPTTVTKAEAAEALEMLRQLCAEQRNAPRELIVSRSSEIIGSAV